MDGPKRRFATIIDSNNSINKEIHQIHQRNDETRFLIGYFAFPRHVFDNLSNNIHKLDKFHNLKLSLWSSLKSSNLPVWPALHLVDNDTRDNKTNWGIDIHQKYPTIKAQNIKEYVNFITRLPKQEKNLLSPISMETFEWNMNNFDFCLRENIKNKY